MRHVLITEDQADLLANGYPIVLTPDGNDSAGRERLRGSGRTTAAMLRAIADALLIPDEWVYFTDHEGPMSNFNCFLDQLSELRDKLGLTLDIQANSRHLRLRSPLRKMQQERRARMGASRLIEDPSQQQTHADIKVIGDAIVMGLDIQK